MHRLDSATGGLVVFARTRAAAAAAALTAQFVAGAVAKRYRALVLGRQAAGAGVLDAPLDGRRCAAWFRVTGSRASVAGEDASDFVGGGLAAFAPDGRLDGRLLRPAATGVCAGAGTLCTDRVCRHGAVWAECHALRLSWRCG